MAAAMPLLWTANIRTYAQDWKSCVIGVRCFRNLDTCRSQEDLGTRPGAAPHRVLFDSRSLRRQPGLGPPQPIESYQRGWEGNYSERFSELRQIRPATRAESSRAVFLARWLGASILFAAAPLIYALTFNEIPAGMLVVLRSALPLRRLAPDHEPLPAQSTHLGASPCGLETRRAMSASAAESTFKRLDDNPPSSEVDAPAKSMPPGVSAQQDTQGRSHGTLAFRT
jgi:hypothetical protein